MGAMKFVSCGLLYLLHVMSLVLGHWNTGTAIQELTVGERSVEFRILVVPSVDVLWHPPVRRVLPVPSVFLHGA